VQILITGIWLWWVKGKERGVLRLSASFLGNTVKGVELGLLVLDQKDPRNNPVLDLAHYPLWKAPSADILPYLENCPDNFTLGQTCT
jgi:hypothetical protein